MTLSDLLRSLDKPAREAFAGRADTSVGYLYLVAGGHRRASAEFAKRIEEASEGKVTRPELRPDIFDAPSEAGTGAISDRRVPEAKAA